VSDDEQKEDLTAERGKFDLAEQGFNPKEASLFDLPLEDEEEEKGKKAIGLDFVDFKGHRFYKGKCYYYYEGSESQVTKEGSESQVTKVAVGIRSFRTEEEANCVRIVHLSQTFLGHGDNGSFADAVHLHYDNEFVQVRAVEHVHVSKLGPPCQDPFPLDLPKLIYEPQTERKKQAFAYVRDNTVRNIVREARKEIRLIEGFSGAGGMHLGYESEGFTTVMAIEYNEQAVKTFKHNNPGVPVHCGDIREFIREVEEDPGASEKLGVTHVIHTSSPCQGFSKANRSGGQNDEANNKLSYTFTHLLRIKQPLCGVFENVEGMWSQKGMKYLRKILIDSIALGYQVRVKILRCKHRTCMLFYVHAWPFHLSPG
jgi:C-5 cytosine-specific DNA methylase